ncbi:MAG: DUF4350 domain-containing protein [Planctomycetota bacterium]|nr:DUF4350 domain-containing protein [Planctomycetota bacterium]
MAPQANNAACGQAGRPAPGEPAPLPARPVLAAAAAMAGAWIAAGSVGLVGHALARGLLLAALAVIVAAVWPGRRFWRRTFVLLAGAAAAAAGMATSTLPVVQVLAMVFALAAAAAMLEGAGRRIVLLAATAVTVFALYRLAATSIPMVWLAADTVGETIGRVAGGITGRPLWVGATFAGVDFLVLMAAVWVAWLAAVSPPRWPRAIAGATAILAVHALYLAVLSLAPDMLAALSAPASEGASPAGADAAWSWAAALRPLVPWNLPVLAAAMHLAVAAAMLRPAGLALGGTALEPSPPADPSRGGSPDLPRDSGDPAPGAGAGAAGRETRRAKLETSRAVLRGGRRRAALAVAAVVLAAAVPLAATLAWGRASLENKRVVFYEKGFLNWLKPVHGEYGRLSIGMYGLLPTFLESLGAVCEISPDLSEADVAAADIVVLLYPNQPWTDGQLERLQRFVRRGGSLLVMGEHTVSEGPAGGSRFNEVLAPTAMQVRFDTAQFEVGGWLDSYEALAHPATAGLTDERNAFGVVIGASVDARWPARPLLVGRWGWADPGDPKSERAMMGNGRYEAGKRLGDVILAAEQPIGAGRVVVFGDPSSFTNGITIGAHAFTSRLFTYLAGGTATPQEPWRGAAALVLAAALTAVLAWRPSGLWMAAAAAAMAAGLALSTFAEARMVKAVPDGTHPWANNLAYIDTTHLSAASGESVRPDGTLGLEMTLMRSGCLALHLREFSAERLQKAGLLVCIAPARAFTEAERQAVRRFVEDGGVLILTVGYDAAGPSRELLADLGLRVGRRPDPGAPARNPEPMGHFKSPYVKVGDYLAHVRFHAAWPVYADDPNDPAVRVIAFGPDDLPVILIRRIGKGKVLLVGDTGFALNKNLEHEGGEPFEGMRENADFWRWMLGVLADREPWLPQPPAAEVRP